MKKQILCALLTSSLALSASAQKITSNASGLESLRVAGTSYDWIRPKTKSGAVFGRTAVAGAVQGSDGKSSKIDDSKGKRSAIDGGNLATFTWGTVETRVSTSPDRVNWQITVTNTSDSIVQGLSLKLAELVKPGGTALFTGNKRVPATDSVLVGTGTWPATPLPDGTIQPAGVAAFVLDQGNAGMEPLTLYPQSPLYPGDVQKFRASLRFGAAKSTAETLAPEKFEQMRKLRPYVLDWPNRRPIGRYFLASSGKHPESNPDGWFNNDPKTDTLTEEGRAAFAQKLLAQAEGVARRTRIMNAQGNIVWDLEGQRFGHPISYLGLPLIRDLDGKVTGVSLPPEMTQPVEYNGKTLPLVDHLFAILSTEGRVGICIRPTNALTSAFGTPVYPSHYQEADWAQTLIDKITYAKARWNCTLFYIDSNLPNATELRRVAQAHPDVLLIPEWASAFAYGATAPYRSAENLNQIEPLSLARQIYPSSFGVVAVGTKNLTKDRPRLLKEIKRGSILFYNAWFEDKMNDDIRKLYEEAF